MKYRHYLPEKIIRHCLAAPFVYMMILPLLILDLFLEIYHRITFSLYQIDYIQRSKYIKIDRHRLEYLSGIDKINCMYCGYANGLLHYASKIAAETEKYWCGIKHEEDGYFESPQHHDDFLPYDDKKAFDDFVNKK